MPTMAHMAAIVDSVNRLILADRRVTVEDISYQQEISVDAVHEIVHDNFAFS